MTTLEDEFVAALDALAVPTADVAEPVMTQLRERSASGTTPDRVRTLGPHRPVATRAMSVAAVVVVIFVGVLLFVTPARDAMARLLGIGATEIEFVRDENSSADDTVTSPTIPAPEARRSPISVEDLAGTPLDPIPTLGPPLGTFDVGVARSRSYFWGPDTDYPEIGETGFGVIVTVRLVDGDAALKRLGGEVGVEFVLIETGDGAIPALWIGGTHEFVADPSSAPVLAERVLVWEVDGVQFRLESSLERDQALVLAADVREGTNLLRPG